MVDKAFTSIEKFMYEVSLICLSKLLSLFVKTTNSNYIDN